MTHDKTPLDKKCLHKKPLLMALLMSTVATPTLADSFFMGYQSLDGVVDYYNQCNETCPQISYQLIDTGHPWLDNRMNKDIIAQLDLSDEEAGSAKETQRQAFLANPNPSKAQLTTQLNQAILSTLAANQAFIKQTKLDALKYTVSATPKYLGYKNHLQLFELATERYTGGAHGMDTTVYYVFDMAAKKQLQLDDIVVPNKKPMLEKLVKNQYEAYLRKNAMNPKDMAKTWTFFLTDNFTFNQAGLHFLYQPYEITPYVMGRPAFTIPYSQLAGLIKPQYL